MKKIALLSLLATSLLCTSCFEDLDDNEQIASTEEINNFIYRGMNFFYLYKSDIPELADDFFDNEGELNEFLDTYQTPEALFDYLTSSQDRFSFLIDDYIELENALGGIRTTNGMRFGLVRYADNESNIFGYIQYVIPGTDADSKGLTRGVLFNTVDGQQLTDTNFNDLLAPDTYTIGLATLDGTTVNPTGENVELTKAQVTENPVHLARTLDVDGTKVGYLMYNSFVRDFATELNNAFASFQAEGATELVVDLRYNGGGFVETAVDLASMITGQFNGQVFATQQWNDDRQAQYAESDVFDNTITDGTPTASLNLNNVYFITTSRTASASEGVINGLKPYINVQQVGLNTAGKYQASFTLYDAPAPSFSRSQANPAHTYAIQPLVYKAANVNGVTDFDDGLVPDIEQQEDFGNLGTLGDPNEPLLATVLNLITGGGPVAPRPATNWKELNKNMDASPIDGLMIAE